MNSEPQHEPAKSAGNLKRRMLLIFGILLLILVVMVILVTTLENWLLKAQTEQPKHGTQQTIIFHTPNYDEDITKDKAYMDRDRQIYYCDQSTGVTISLRDFEYAEHGEGVELLCHMIESIIAGDHEAYNSFFSEEYLDREGEKDMFTAQKLYEIKITLLSSEEIIEDGLKSTVETFTLEYMIYQNNGTFRTDVGSDAIRKQHVVVSDREGDMKIDSIVSHTYSYS
jgi:hypothetical protein